MKIQFYKKDFLFLVIILPVVVLLTSCQNNTKNIDNHKLNNAYENGFTDFDGAMLYEFNMIKDPVTGKIPEGVFEQEKAQAKALLKQQQDAGIIAVNPYTFQGPDNLGGRTRTIAYDIRYNGTSNRIIMAGGVSGGVYKSTDDGATWVRKSPTGEHFSCTSIAQDTRVGFRDTWYYGTGESTGNSASGTSAFYHGNGVYKSTDNGETWVRLAASNTSTLETFSVGQDDIQKVIVDPTDGNIYVACLAKIMRSTDGGTTWVDVLPGVLGNTSQATDVVVSSTGRLYASFSGTNDSGVDGVWASAPGPTSGDVGSWTRIAGAGAGGSPVGWNFEAPSASPPTAGGYGRVVLAIPPSAETLLYALYWKNLNFTCGAPSPEAELFRWDDVGGTWTDLSATLPDVPLMCLSGNDPFAVQGGYDLVIAAKPDAASTLFLGGTNAYRSTDAGLTWTRIGGYDTPASYALYPGSHPDIHAFAFQPGSPLIMLCGNDGGIQRTTDDLAGSVAWTPINTGYHTYQYYYVTPDPHLANAKVLGGAQDNGSTRNISGTGTGFEMVYGGDGVSVGISLLDSEYVGSQNGFIHRRRSADLSGYTTDITPIYANTVTSAGLFITLFRLDPDNTERLYYANDDTLYRTTSASTVTSTTWTKMTGVAAAVGTPNDITALATTRGTYSAATASLFMGTSNGKVFRLDDPTGVAAGTGPVDITGAGFPAAGYVSSIAVNPRNDDTILVTFSNYSVSSVWWTGNANSAVPTWTAIENTTSFFLPSFRTSAIAVTATGVNYFVGTSTGLYTTTAISGGTTAWTQEGPSEIGNAVVSNLALRKEDNRLLVGTHGYGMWYTSLSLPIIPITLTEFKGTLQEKSVLLQWSTATESNSKHFELEKSFDGIVYRKIATIPAAGNSSTSKQYSYIDREPLTEKNYYRLRSVDIDGKYKLSNIVLIKPPGMQQDILVLGNPFKNNIQVRFVKSPETGGELRLTDMTGRLMASRSFNQGEQQLQFIIPSGKLSKGVYILQAVINGNRFTKKVQRE
jgi:hypothetical protein